MIIDDFEVRNHEKLDTILTKLCEMIIQGQKKNMDLGMVAAAVLDPDNNCVVGINYPAKDGRRIHAERAAIDSYKARFGEIPPGSIILTTCSPCSEHMDERYGESCTDLINQSGVHKVYCGYQDPTQDESSAYEHKQFHVECTKNFKLEDLCRAFAETFLKDELNELSFLGSPCTKDCSGHLAGYEWTRSHPGRPALSRSQSFNNGNALFLGGKE
jgi:pyrimidine deaminase RibD-like protein